MSAPNCPFYGSSLYATWANAARLFVLLDSGGNQCGLITDRITPCYMEMNQLPIEWRECPYVKEIRIKLPSSGTNVQPG